MIIYLLVILGVLACSVSQLLLKTSANKEHRLKIFEIINPLVLFSYVVFFMALLINIWAMRKGVQLKEIAILESLGYILVPLLSFLVLKEHISKRMILAILIIISGVLVFYI